MASKKNGVAKMAAKSVNGGKRSIIENGANGIGRQAKTK
jgi:hypothetical protein